MRGGEAREGGGFKILNLTRKSETSGGVTFFLFGSWTQVKRNAESEKNGGHVKKTGGYGQNVVLFQLKFSMCDC